MAAWQLSIIDYVNLGLANLFQKGGEISFRYL